MKYNYNIKPQRVKSEINAQFEYNSCLIARKLIMIFV